MSRNFILLLYYAITILCVIISGILSFEGFRRSFPDQFLTLLFVIVIVLGLFGADALIQRARTRGERLLAPVLLLAIFSIFSTSSNFNAIYTRFMEGDAVEAALETQLTVFRNDLTNTRSALELDPGVQDLISRRIEIERELERLENQVSDPVRPGCGIRCQGHLQRIEELLGKRLTDVAQPPPGASKAFIQDWFARIEAAVWADWTTATSDLIHTRMRNLMSKIDETLGEYEGSPTDIRRDKGGLEALDRLSEISAEIERDANADLEDSNSVSHSPIDTTLGRLGEIAYSFRNAFVQMPNALATFLSLVLGAVVDLFPVAFALAAFSPTSGGPQANLQRRRGRAGKVLD